MQTMTTINDLRDWVGEHVSREVGLKARDAITEAIRRDRNSPAWGRDWSDYLDSLPENLCDLIGGEK